MVNEEILIKKYSRTNLFIINENDWAWAQFRSKTLGYDSVAEYIFALIQEDRKNGILKETKTQ